MRPTLAAALAALAAVAAPAAALARSEKTVPYDVAQVFPTAVRFLRIDAGVKIVEKDADAGYVLFDLSEEHRTFRGALELVKTEVGGREAVRLVLRIDDRPSYEEDALLEKLDDKLRGELGRPKPGPKKKGPDADGNGADNGSDAGSGGGSGGSGGSGSGAASDGR